MKPNFTAEKLSLGHAVQAIIHKAQTHQDREALENVRNILRESANRVDGILSGLPPQGDKK